MRMLKYTVLSLVLFITCGTVHAQPHINFKRITVNWPTIELYFVASCNGSQYFSLTKQDFRVVENGADVPDFTLTTPNPAHRERFSVSLVFDASGSMSGIGNAGAKQAGRAFIDLMNGVSDEASIIWFSQTVTIQQQMTTIKPLLNAAIDALPALGATAMWDGCYTGIVELINNGVHDHRAVIVLTDGAWGSSSRTPSEVMSLANRNRIRVFTVGLGSSINATELEMVALSTGGRYYQTDNAAHLAAIYQEIAGIIMQGFQESVITYQRDCADGGLRNVDLQWTFCGGADVKTKTYRALHDSATYSDLELALDDAQAFGGEEIVVPLRMLTTMDNEVLHTMRFDIQYGSCLAFKGVTTPPGMLLENVPLTVTLSSNTVNIQTGDTKIINGNGPLMELHFSTNDPGDDTLCCELRAENATMSAGCRMLQIAPGDVCVFPRQAEVACTLDGPRSITWDSTAWEYSPASFDVTARYFNTGSGTARNGRYTIQYPGADIQLVSPMTDTQTGSPPDIPPGGFAAVTWRISPLQRAHEDSLRICIRAAFDNHPWIDGCILVHRPAIPPPLQVALDSSGALTFCEGDSVNLWAPAALDSYLWSTGDTTRGITVQKSGDYHCEVRLPTGQRGTTDTVSVTVHPLPQSTIALNGNNPLCDGDTLLLDAGAGFTSYRWLTAGGQTRVIAVTRAGLYFAEIMDANGCTGFTDTVQVSLLPAPPKPVITRNGDDLQAPVQMVNYLWHRNDQPIPGGNGPTLHITQTGSYRVRVMNASGCAAWSDPFVVTVLAVANEVRPSAVRIALYPDPAHDVATLKVDIPSTQSATVWLVGLLGRRRQIARVLRGTGSVELKLDLTSVPVGMYHVIVQTADRTVMRKFMRR